MGRCGVRGASLDQWMSELSLMGRGVSRSVVFLEVDVVRIAFFWKPRSNYQVFFKLGRPGWVRRFDPPPSHVQPVVRETKALVCGFVDKYPYARGGQCFFDQ